MQSPVAIITGAGRGIGRATALELASRGYRLTLASRNQKEIQAVAEQAKSAIAVAADVTRLEDVQGLADQTRAAYGRIDAIVNNVGLAPVAKVDELTIEQWHAVIDTNLSSAFYLARAVWSTFKKQRGGCIVNISSMASRDPLPGFLAYGAAKAGLNVLSLMLAREGAEHGIRSYAIAPGAVETGMFRRMVSREKWPAEKTLDPADVARVVAQCIDGDLKYASGEVIFLSRTLS